MDPVVITVDGTVLPKQGLVIFAGSSAMTGLTIPAPTPGLQSAGGDDGLEVQIISSDGYADILQTPAGALNKTKHKLAFGVPGSGLTLTAYNGVWYSGPEYGVVLT